LGFPLVSIRPGIVARSGGEIHVPPCEGRIQGGPDGPAAWHASASPQVAAMATITGVGRGAIMRLARVTAMAAITAPLSSRTAAADRRLDASAPGCLDGTIRSPASYPTRARERQSSEVWCQPAGAGRSRGRMLLSGLGPAPPGSSMPPHSGLGCKGRE